MYEKLIYEENESVNLNNQLCDLENEYRLNNIIIYNDLLNLIIAKDELNEKINSLNFIYKQLNKPNNQTTNLGDINLYFYLMYSNFLSVFAALTTNSTIFAPVVTVSWMVGFISTTPAAASADDRHFIQ